MKRNLATILAIMAFASAAIVTSVAAETPPKVEAAWWWENWTGSIRTYPDNLTLSQGFINADNPHWITQSWGWTSPWWKAQMMLKFCEFNYSAGRWEMHIWKANAWLNEHVNGTKWADRTGPWHSYLIDRTPAAGNICGWRAYRNEPFYF